MNQEHETAEQKEEALIPPPLTEQMPYWPK